MKLINKNENENLKFFGEKFFLFPKKRGKIDLNLA